MLDIDLLSDNQIEMYFEHIFKVMELDPNAPFDYQVSTRPEWLEFLDKKVDEIRHTISISKIVCKKITGTL